MEPVTWPKSRLERVSINSFGFGGSNAHVIIDSVSSFVSSKLPEEKSPENKISEPHLMLYSANSFESLTQMTSNYTSYINSNPDKIADLAHTLANGRKHMPHRTFAIAKRDGIAKTSPMAKIDPTTNTVVMVFTGQGAQWPQMGRDLLQWNSTFRDSVRTMDQYLSSLADAAPPWSLEAELCKPSKISRLYEAEIAQPTLTAIQIALVDTLASVGTEPTAVVGHSGGEVAAAYAAGALTAKEAIIVSLNRGAAIKNQTRKGAM